MVSEDGPQPRRRRLAPRVPGPARPFDRLDRDNDGLIDPDEAAAGEAAKGKDAPK